MFVWARQKVHVSWHIAMLGSGILLGVSTVFAFRTSLFAAIGWFVASIILFVLVCLWRFRWLLLCSLLAGCLLGAWRGSLELLHTQAYQPFFGQQVRLSGEVAEDVVRNPDGSMKLTLTSVRIDEMSVTGKVWLSSQSKVKVKRSDVLEAHGKLKDGFGAFQASMTFASIAKVQRPVAGDVARDVRDWFAAGVKKAIPDPQASLGVGYVLGLNAGLPPDLGEALKIVGLTHIVVASGYNLTILVRAARRFFARYSKFLAAMAALGMIMAFILITGASPSMTRAGLVAGISLLAWYYGRKTHPFVLLSFAAALTVMLNPFYLSGDLGWYLSFLAFFGVIVVAPLLHRYFWGDKPAGVLRQICVDTFAAQLVTVPVIAIAFGTFSVYALPANLLILPFVPVAMVLTFVAGIIGVLAPAFAEIAGWPAYVVLKAMIGLADWLSRLPGASGYIVFSMVEIVVFYCLIIALVWFFKHKTNYNFRDTNLVE